MMGGILEFVNKAHKIILSTHYECYFLGISIFNLRAHLFYNKGEKKHTTP